MTRAREQGTESIGVEGPSARLHVSDGGAGKPAVLFVHSLGGRHSQWAAQVEHLRPGRRATAFDMRGHGASDGARDGDYSLVAMAADVEAVAEDLGLERFILVGHSLGAGVATVYAGAHPDRVTGLLLVDPIGEQRRARDEVESFVSRLREGPYREAIEDYWKAILVGSHPEVRETVLSDLGDASPEAVIAALEGTLEFDPAADLARFGGPVLVVRTPMNDFPYSLHRVVEGVPDEVVTDTSHWLQMDRPARFNALLTGFIRRVEDG